MIYKYMEQITVKKEIATLTLRFFAMIFLPLILIYALVGWGALHRQKAAYIKEHELVESNRLEMETRLFKSTLSGYLADGAILGDVIAGILDQTSNEGAGHEHIADIFKAYALHHRIYDQMRYIDKNGMEIVRVNWRADKGAWTTPPEALQNKSHRPYFINGIRQPLGSCYLSAFDLNMEHGKVEQPIKPMLRMVFPIFLSHHHFKTSPITQDENPASPPGGDSHSKDEISGVLVLNLIGWELLENMTNDENHSAGNVFLINEKGHWLKGPSPDLEWQFMFSDTPQTVQDRYPLIWEQISRHPLEKRFQCQNGLSFYAPIAPSTLFQTADSASPPLRIEAKEQWYLVHFVQHNALIPPKSNLLISFLISGSALLAILAWFASGLMGRRTVAMQQLQAKEQELQTIAHSVQDAIIMVDDKGHAVFWNRSAQKVLGFTEDEILGKNIHQFITPPEFRERSRKGMINFTQKGQGDIIGHLREVEALRKDGSCFPAELNINAVQIENRWWAVGVLRDISKRKTQEKALAVREAQMKMFIKYTPAAVAMFDREIQYLMASDRWYSDYGLKGQEIIGKSHYEIFPEIDEKPEWKAHHQRCLAGEVVKKDEDAFVRADGTTEWLRWEVHPWIDDSGETGGIIMFTEVITQRKRMEERLKASEQKYRSLSETLEERVKERTRRLETLVETIREKELDRQRTEEEAKKLAMVVEKTSTGVIITDKKGEIEWFNEGFKRISGYSLDEVRGQSPGGVLQGPETDPDTILEIGKALGAGKGINVEILNYHKSGRAYWVELDIQPIFSDDGELMQYIAIETDITKRKTTEDALTQFKSTLDQTHDAVFMFHPTSLKFFYVNQGAVEQLGYDRATLLEMTPVDIKPDIPEKKFKAMIQPLMEGAQKKLVFETVHAHKSGRHIPVDILLQLINDKESTPRFVAIVRDITEQKKFLMELSAARDAAEEAAKAKGEFLANMSHEIRTPMNAIIGMAYLAGQTELTPRQQDYINNIGTSAKALLSIINDILDFSKIDAGKMTIEQVPFDLRDIINDIVVISAGAISNKGLDLQIAIDDRISPVLIGDPVRLGQVLNNLLNNAVKFTPKGDIEIQARLKTRYSQTEILEFKMMDSGIGMNKAQLSRIFQTFSQADSATTRKYGGTGLGLAICRQLVHLMGGEVFVESTPQKGSTFTFTVALGYKKSISPQSPSQMLPLNLRNLRVMLIDANPKNLANLARQLKSLSFEVTEENACTLGMEAMERAVMEKHPFELAIMDYRNCMDEAGSTEEGIWKIITPEKIPTIIMASVNDLVEAEQTFGQMEQVYLLSKPVVPSNLFNAIVEAFGYRELSIGTRHIAAKSYQKENRKKLQGIRVLLVEDNPMNQQVARELLEQMEISVTIADNGVEALRMVKHTPVDLILMDIQMPKMDGITTTRKIREMGGIYASLPIIAMTANAMIGDREKSLDAGMNDHIAKPVDPDKLYGCLMRWVATTEDLSPNKVSPSPVHPSQSEWAKRLPGIDVVTGLRQVGGNFKLYDTFLSQFSTTYHDAPQQIKTLLASDQSDQMEEATRLAHSAKGLAGTIGAKTLEEAFMAVERSLRENRASHEEVLDNLKKALEKEMPIISAALPLMDDHPGVNGQIHPSKTKNHETQEPGKESAVHINGTSSMSGNRKLSGKIEALKKMLRAHDMASQDLFEEIKPELEGQFPDEMTKITGELAVLKFKSTLTILNTIHQQLDRGDNEK